MTIEFREIQDVSPASVTFRNITFSDDNTINLEPNDVLVLVGPNNAGKSAALRELEKSVDAPQGNTAGNTVISSVQLRHIGTPEKFRQFIEPHVKITYQGGSTSVTGTGFSLGIGNRKIEDLWPSSINLLSRLFCVSILTERRITDSNPVNSFDALNDIPSHPIHTLYLDDEIEGRISGYFRRAFGEDLILYRTGGNRLPLLVGDRISPNPGEDRVSSTYSKRLTDSTVQLESQGDGMRSFASVILHLLAPTTPSILLLDEPEAFLHPPQARLLGEIIAAERSAHAQLIVATHSPDVLHGLTNVASDTISA